MKKLQRKVKVRRLTRAPKAREEVKATKPYRIKARYLSYDRWIMPGEIGAFLSDANGFGRFFPDKGGVCMKVADADVERVAVVKAPKVRKVRRLKKQ